MSICESSSDEPIGENPDDRVDIKIVEPGLVFSIYPEHLPERGSDSYTFVIGDIADDMKRELTPTARGRDAVIEIAHKRRLATQILFMKVNPIELGEEEEEHSLFSRVFTRLYADAASKIDQLDADEMDRLWDKYEGVPACDVIEALSRRTDDRESIGHIQKIVWLLLEKHGQ